MKRLLAINWFRTLQLNFGLLPWRQALRCPLVAYGPLRVRLGAEARVLLSPDAQSFGSVVLGSRHETYQAAAGKGQFTLLGRWVVNGRFRLGVDSCLYVHRGATLTTGHEVYLARDTQIECAESVTIGHHVLAGELYVCDTAAHRVQHGQEPARGLTQPIAIGDGCYLGFRTMMLRGAHIPPHSVVGSGAVCTRDYAALHPQGHLFLVGVPALVKATDVTPDCLV